METTTEPLTWAWGCQRRRQAGTAPRCLPFGVRGHGGVDGDHGVVRGQQGDGGVPARHAGQGRTPERASSEGGAGAGANRPRPPGASSSHGLRPPIEWRGRVAPSRLKWELEKV